jgi:hypothetical protein
MAPGKDIDGRPSLRYFSDRADPAPLFVRRRLPIAVILMNAHQVPFRRRVMGGHPAKAMPAAETCEWAPSGIDLDH